MYRVTLDANAYISAFQFGGRAARLLHMTIDGDIEIAISEPILTEVIRVLREKFAWEGYRLLGARQRILSVAKLVEPTRAVDEIPEDPPDNRILECALETGSEFIISADNDLLRRGTYAGIKIVRVGDFLREIQPGREG